jgi:DhnA family fructose-bisphosphate aldolase class Ia
MVAMDHAIVIGPVPGMVDPRETVRLLSKEKPDTFFMPVGAIKQVYPSFIEHRIPFIASIDACTFMGPEKDYYMLSDTVEHALSIGASAVSAHVFVGPQKTSDMLKGISQVAIECDRLGMPLLAIMYPWGFENNFDVKLVKWAARIGAELGADLVKTFYTGSKESFLEVIESCPIPVLLSGGDKTSDPKDFLHTLKTCMDCGARGVAVGRNVWQSESPAAVLRAVLKIVHENCSVDEAVK